MTYTVTLSLAATKATEYAYTSGEYYPYNMEAFLKNNYKAKFVNYSSDPRYGRCAVMDFETEHDYLIFLLKM